ncbi:ANTAR domain-containing protein [Catellatospora sp. NPDC049609]|uniref:ANTAR domain-containing protein n=1 Tax=Catellatospora sp. NPDC049609 TaxID=3155505 RepID=UPI00344607CC
MIDERVMRVWAQVGKQTRGARVTVADICTAAVAGVGADGAGVTVTTRAAAREPVHATDRIAGELELWQSAHGQGPGVDACTTGGPVLAADLRSPGERTRWPEFTPAALGSGAQAVFALPMQVGAIRLGVVDLYRASPGPMSAYELADALAFTEAVALLLLDGSTGAPADTAELAWQRDDPSAHHAQVHQATGMLAARLGITAESAFARLRAHAFACGRPQGDVAHDVIEGGRATGVDLPRQAEITVGGADRCRAARLTPHDGGLPAEDRWS